MSNSISIQGVIPKDEKYKKMKAVWDACYEAGVALPEAVKRFFDYGALLEAGVQIPLNDHECCKKNPDTQVHTIEIDDLPKAIKIIHLHIVTSCK
jgi:hypothetical protein